MENRFSITHAASSTCGRAKTKFLLVGMTNTQISIEEIMVDYPRIAETTATATQRFASPIKAANIPRPFTTGTSGEIVIRQQRPASTAPKPS